MARVLGKSGRYVSQEATRLLHLMWTLCIICMAVVGTILGFILRASVPWFTVRPLNGVLFSVVLLLVLWLAGSWTFRRVDELETERGKWRQGARGEEVVGAILSRLPDGYRVINDFPTGSGNLDHIVIGPTGVFVLETKSWRGVIGANEEGELTQNGKPATSAHVGGFIRRIMGVREKILVLASGRETFFQGVMVFTRAWVEAPFGATRQAHCIRDDKLFNYLTDGKSGRRLAESDIEAISCAFASLARQDAEFGGVAEAAPQEKQGEAGGSLCAARAEG